MPSIPPEYLPVINTIILSVMTAAGAAVVKWFMWKTAQWERMAEETRIKAEDAKKEAHEAREFSQGNRNLLERTLEKTEQIERHSNGMGARLNQIAAVSAFRAGELKGEIGKAKNLTIDELEALEKEFKDAIKIAGDTTKDNH